MANGGVATARIFAATAAVSVLSKYVIRVRGRYVFKPVEHRAGVVLLVLGSPGQSARPAAGETGLGSRFRPGHCHRWTRHRVAARNAPGRGRALVDLAASMAVIAAAGHAITTRWYVESVQGGCSGWCSPPPRDPAFVLRDHRPEDRARRQGGAGDSWHMSLSGLLFFVAPQQTEFGTKVAILSGLAIVCAPGATGTACPRLLTPSGTTRCAGFSGSRGWLDKSRASHAGALWPRVWRRHVARCRVTVAGPWSCRHPSSLRSEHG